MADKGPRKSADDFDQMTTDDEIELVTEQLHEMDKGTLVGFIMQYAWEEVREVLNNETIERWANAHDDEHGKPLDEREYSTVEVALADCDGTDPEGYPGRRRCRECGELLGDNHRATCPTGQQREGTL